MNLQLRKVVHYFEALLLLLPLSAHRAVDLIKIISEYKVNGEEEAKILFEREKRAQ
jgi:hypothetical protein